MKQLILLAIGICMAIASKAQTVTIINNSPCPMQVTCLTWTGPGGAPPCVVVIPPNPITIVVPAGATRTVPAMPAQQVFTVTNPACPGLGNVTVGTSLCNPQSSPLFLCPCTTPALGSVTWTFGTQTLLIN